MKKQLLVLGILGASLFSPAYAGEPISFKAKFLVKTAALAPFRFVKFVVVDDYGVRDAAHMSVYSEILNMRSRGEGYESFEMFSWGD